MPVNTVTAAITLTPVAIKTLFKHVGRKTKKTKKKSSMDDILYDEAFHIVKGFLEFGTRNTVESLQAFTNTRVVYQTAACPVLIPLSTCNSAADILIDIFGCDELKQVVGGERWWQVRGLDGIEAEWITEKDHLKHDTDNRLSGEKSLIFEMESLQPIMLYAHGGGFFWGSINTHRYQVVHYTRLMRGRAFLVNYRKAPQYPWPCPLQDVLAAYLYLIRPPADAIHKPISPCKIVLAGDSAGANLCLTVLTILRDLDLPMPAGAVLISPWVDLTHSFPSIMENAETDILPRYGFIAKPSTLWPPDLLPPREGRVVPTAINPPRPGQASTSPIQRTEDAERIMTQNEMLSDENTETGARNRFIDSELDETVLEPPKILMEDPHAIPLELQSQIHLYATTEQLTHPLVSPLLQGSLGNLPPLYILAGNDEMLRDEAIYLGHRAAYPHRFPVRPGILRDSMSQQNNAEKFLSPTQVHLRVFDGMCHALTVFTLTTSAKYAYSSIAEFTRHVTDCNDTGLNNATSPHGQLSNDNANTDQSDKNPATDNVAENLSKVGHSLSETSYSYIDESRTNSKGKGRYFPTQRMPTDALNKPMKRERVDIDGRTRPMEPLEDMSVLKLPIEQIGVLKEGPVKRWHEGQSKWDRKCRRSAKRAIQKRAKFGREAAALIETARRQGFVHVADIVDKNAEPPSHAGSAIGVIQPDRRWGPIDLREEQPPPTAIAGTPDTAEAIALLKKSLYHTAPVTHIVMPVVPSRRKKAVKPPRQSVAEQQIGYRIMPVHGLALWAQLLKYFGRKGSDAGKKAANGAKNAMALVRSLGANESS